MFFVPTVDGCAIAMVCGGMPDTFASFFSEHLARWIADEPDRSRSSFAAAVGADPAQITRWAREAGGLPDPKSTLPKLCRALGLSVTESRRAYALCGVPLDAVLTPGTAP